MFRPTPAQTAQRGAHHTFYTIAGCYREICCATGVQDENDRVLWTVPNGWQTNREVLTGLFHRRASNLYLTGGPCDHLRSDLRSHWRLTHFFRLHVASVGSHTKANCGPRETLGFAIGDYRNSHWYSKSDGQPRCPARGCPAEKRRREAYPGVVFKYLCDQTGEEKLCRTEKLNKQLGGYPRDEYVIVNRESIRV